MVLLWRSLGPGLTWSNRWKNKLVKQKPNKIVVFIADNGVVLTRVPGEKGHYRLFVVFVVLLIEKLCLVVSFVLLNVCVIHINRRLLQHT